MLDFPFSKDISYSSEVEEKQIPFGFHAGKIVRLFGGGSKNICADFLGRHRQQPAAWIDPELRPFPAELINSSMNWEKVLFISGEEEKEWALKCLLSSGLFPIIIFRADCFSKRFFPSIRQKLVTSQTMLILISNSSSIGSYIDEDFFAYERDQLISLSSKGEK